MPEYLDALKAKHIFKERSKKGYPNELLLAATQTKGVIRKEEYECRTVIVQKDFHLLKLVKEDDFVISLRSFQGGVEYAYHITDHLRREVPALLCSKTCSGNGAISIPSPPLSAYFGHIHPVILTFTWL